MYARLLFSITYDGLYSARCVEETPLLRVGSDAETSDKLCWPVAWLQHDRASPARAGRPVRKPPWLFAAQGKQAAALHMASAPDARCADSVVKERSSALVKRAGYSYIVVRLTGCKSRCKGLVVWTFLGPPETAEMGKVYGHFLDMAEWRG